MSQEVQFKGYACKGKGEALAPWSYTPRPLGDEDVEIKISHCGICHSDIHTLDSGWGPTTYPVIAGHEVVGTVTAKGKSVSHLSVGDRVGVGAQVWACLEKQSCKTCNVGADNHCPRIVYTYNSSYEDGALAYGGYQEQVRVSSHYAFKIPDGLPSDASAPLLCAGTTVYAPLARAGVKKGTRVGVVGIGGLGHFALQFASKMGADVTAISTSVNKKDDAIKLGAHNFLVSSDPAAVKKAARSLDIIICTVADNIDYSLYLGLLDFDGKFVMVGLPEGAISFAPFDIVARRISVSGSAIGSIQEIKDMLQFAADHKIVAWMQKMPMSQVNEGLALVRANKPRFRIVLEN